MIVAAAFLAASTFAMAEPPKDGMLSFRDYPVQAVVEDRSAAAVVQVVIDTTGTVSACRIGQTYGDRALANQICPIVQRKHWTPARTDKDGPRYAVKTTLVKLFVPDRKDGREIEHLKEQPDASFTVSRLPDDAREATVKIAFSVDADGRIETCAPAAQEKSAALVQIVCGARSPLGAQKQVDRAGKPIAYVTSETVGLVVGGPPAQGK